MLFYRSPIFYLTTICESLFAFYSAYHIKVHCNSDNPQNTYNIKQIVFSGSKMSDLLKSDIESTSIFLGQVDGLFEG